MDLGHLCDTGLGVVAIANEVLAVAPQERCKAGATGRNCVRRRFAVGSIYMSNNPKSGLRALLSPEDCVVLLVDHQPFQFTNLHSHEPSMVLNNVVGLAKTAKLFGVPTILSTVVEDKSGLLVKELQDVFPEQKPIDRTWINAWQDPLVVKAVERTGRKKLVVAGLWTEICLAMVAIQAQGEGYEVIAVTDASGGSTAEAHDMAVRRMIQAGVTPMNWLAFTGEWQRDWARGETVPGLSEVLFRHAGATGLALQWETQLLSSGAKHPK
jgi:nicotinamidase-related amidase